MIVSIAELPNDLTWGSLGSSKSQKVVDKSRGE
jgi:hypothetical protein